MKAARHIEIGIRSQATLIFFLAALWCGSFFGWLWEMGSTRIFWTAIFFFTPFVMPLFALILLISDRRTGRRHKWLVRFSVFAASLPWILFLFLLADWMLE
jgi:hypothetical protein